MSANLGVPRTGGSMPLARFVCLKQFWGNILRGTDKRLGRAPGWNKR